MVDAAVCLCSCDNRFMSLSLSLSLSLCSWLSFGQNFVVKASVEYQQVRVGCSLRKKHQVYILGLARISIPIFLASLLLPLK